MNRTEFLSLQQPNQRFDLRFWQGDCFLSPKFVSLFGIIHAVGPKVPPKKEPIGESIAVAGIKGISCLSMFK